MARKEHNYQQHLQLLAQLAIIFGGKCAECGCQHFTVFEFDHKDGGGVRERKTLAGKQWHRNLLDECKNLNGPKEGIQLLCAKCHAKKLSKAVRDVRLTTKRVCTVLGNMSPENLCRLVKEGKIKGKAVAKGRRSNQFEFTVQAILDYVFSSNDISTAIQQRILGNKKDPARSQRGKENRLKARDKCTAGHKKGSEKAPVITGMESGCKSRMEKE